jgi:hypothetical protein
MNEQLLAKYGERIAALPRKTQLEIAVLDCDKLRELLSAPESLTDEAILLTCLSTLEDLKRDLEALGMVFEPKHLYT